MPSSATSHALAWAPSMTAPGLGYSTGRSSIPMRAASARARSQAGPRNSPVTGSLMATGGLPSPTPTRTLPDATRSATLGSGDCWASAATAPSRTTAMSGTAKRLFDRAISITVLFMCRGARASIVAPSFLRCVARVTPNAIYPELRYLISPICVSRSSQSGSPDDGLVAARLVPERMEHEQRGADDESHGMWKCDNAESKIGPEPKPILFKRGKPGPVDL